MSDDELTVSVVRQFLQSRPIDMAVAIPHEGFVFALRAHFDGYNEFFRVMTRDVEYLDVVGNFPLGDLTLIADFREVLRYPGAARWRRHVEKCSGTTLLLRSADADDWDSAREEDLNVIVANTLVLCRGPQWPIVP